MVPVYTNPLCHVPVHTNPRMPGSSLVLTQTVYARFQNEQCAIRKEQLLPFVASLTFPKLDCILNTTYCYTNIPVILCYDDIIFEPNLIVSVIQSDTILNTTIVIQIYNLLNKGS